MSGTRPGGSPGGNTGRDRSRRVRGAPWEPAHWSLPRPGLKPRVSALAHRLGQLDSTVLGWPCRSGNTGFAGGLLDASSRTRAAVSPLLRCMLRKRQECHTTTVETANNEVCEKSFCTLLAAMKPNCPPGWVADRGRVDRNALELHRAGRGQGGAADGRRRRGPARHLRRRRNTSQTRLRFHRGSSLRRLSGASWGTGPGTNGSRLFEGGERPHGLAGKVRIAPVCRISR